jgi:hypothetical protein
MEKGHEPSRAELKIFQLELWLVFSQQFVNTPFVGIL